MRGRRRGVGRPSAAPDAEVPHASYGWNHGFAEILGSLLAEGLRLTRFEEGERIPGRAWPGMVQEGPHFRLPEGHVRMPLSFTLELTAG